MKLTLKTEEADYVRAQYLHRRPNAVVLVLGIILLGFILFVATAIILNGTLHGQDLQVLLITAGSLGFCALVFFVILPLNAKRIYRQQKWLQLPADIHVTGESYHVKSEFGEATLPWKGFHKWKENQHLFLVYQSDILFHMWPKRCFPSPEAIHEFRAILESQIGKQGI